jgi:G3E family GTPase
MIDNLYQTMSEFLSSDQNVEEVDNDDDEELPILVTIPDSDKKVPVTILTGFLGSGKTTLLNYILSANHGKKIAVIENEFSGGLGIEGMIAKSGLDGGDLNGFFVLNNGCICCTVKEDLLTTLEQLVMHKDRFDYIIIETTGVANPGPVITTFWSDDAIESSLKLDGVVCVVDSLNIQSYLQTEDIANDVRMQLSYAGNHLILKLILFIIRDIFQSKFTNI